MQWDFPREEFSVVREISWEELSNGNYIQGQGNSPEFLWGCGCLLPDFQALLSVNLSKDLSRGLSYQYQSRIWGLSSNKI